MPTLVAAGLAIRHKLACSSSGRGGIMHLPMAVFCQPLNVLGIEAWGGSPQHVSNLRDIKTSIERAVCYVKKSRIEDSFSEIGRSLESTHVRGVATHVALRVAYRAITALAFTGALRLAISLRGGLRQNNFLPSRRCQSGDSVGAEKSRVFDWSCPVAPLSATDVGARLATVVGNGVMSWEPPSIAPRTDKASQD